VNETAGAAPLRLHRNLTFAALGAVAAVAWAFLVRGESAMTSMADEGPLGALMRVMMRPSEPLPYFLAAALMWVVMMIAMMTPAVMPMVAVLRGVARGPHRERVGLLFAGGYLAAWSLFGVLAALVQLALHARGMLAGHLLTVSAAGAGVLLLIAGVYQLTPWKTACLRHCRSPMAFFLEHWRPGAWGAVRMGVHHGISCVGCCWMLMLLMFVGGAMSVLTMALLCVFILAERLLPPGPWVSRIPGIAMIACGAAMAAWR
jgi:predicted metal-binding membrane protein